MSNASKFLLIAMGLIITFILCAIGFNIMNKGRSSVNATMDSYDDMIGQVGDVKFSIYADSSASGSDVVNLVKNLKASDGVNIVVTNKSGSTVTYSNTTGTVAGKDTSGVTYTLADISDRSKTAAYINSLASFDGSLSRDANGVITAVNFVQR